MVHVFGSSIGALGLVSGGFVLGSIFGGIVIHFLRKQQASAKAIFQSAEAKVKSAL